MPRNEKVKGTKPSKDTLVLNVNDVRINADPVTLASMMNALIHVPSFRKSFEQDPVRHLRENGIEVPEQIAKQINADTIRATLEDLTEGQMGEEESGSRAPAAAPVVVVRVGTRPGTRPGVNVGVRVATQTQTFGGARSGLGMEEGAPASPHSGTGLRDRQDEQAKKRQRGNR